MPRRLLSPLLVAPLALSSAACVSNAPRVAPSPWAGIPARPSVFAVIPGAPSAARSDHGLGPILAQLLGRRSPGLDAPSDCLARDMTPRDPARERDATSLGDRAQPVHLLGAAMAGVGASGAAWALIFDTKRWLSMPILRSGGGGAQLERRF